MRVRGNLSPNALDIEAFAPHAGVRGGQTA